MFQMLGVFAEFEHAMIRERVMARLAPCPLRGQTAWQATSGAGQGPEGEGRARIARPGHWHPPDSRKKIKGKKRHVLVDTLGLLLHAINAGAATDGGRRVVSAFIATALRPGATPRQHGKERPAS